MKTKLLFLVGMLAIFTSARAADGALSITNITNLIPGQTGTLDIVLSGSDHTYRDFQFDITLPTGLTFVNSAPTAGALLNGHVIDYSDQGSNTRRFTGVTSATKTMTAQNGTLMTISFNVASTVSGTLGTGNISNIRMSDASATSYTLSDVSAIPFVLTIALSEEASPVAQNGVYVTMTRTFTADKWNTICLPFPMTAAQVTSAFGTGVQIGDFNGYTIDGNTINVSFTSVTSMLANHPYIIKVTSDVTSFSITDATVDISPITTPINNKGTDATDANIMAMTGVYAETTLAANLLYLKDNKFKYSTGSAKLKPYHAYFQFRDFSPSAAARALTISVDDHATGIQSVVVPWSDNEAVYDLQGRRVEVPANGVYIQNGSKAVIKRERNNR